MLLSCVDTYLNRIAAEAFEPAQDCPLQPVGVAAALAAMSGKLVPQAPPDGKESSVGLHRSR